MLLWPIQGIWRIWHRGLLAKLYHFGVRGQAHSWITNYLSDRRQCVRLNGCDSSWLAVPAGVPQGSVLGPLLFLAYTIDLPNCVAVPTSCDQFADDTALTTVSPSPTECEGHLQRSVDATSTWLSEWKLAVNVDKTVSMEFTRRPFSSDFAINLNGNTLKKVRMQRHLGLVLTSDLRWTAHVNQVLSKAARLLHTLKRLRCTLSKAALTLYYCLYIRPVVEYGCVAWPKLPAHLRDRLERFQRRAFKVILRKPLFEHCDHDAILLAIQQPSLESRRQYQAALLGFQLAHETAPKHLLKPLSPKPAHLAHADSELLFSSLYLTLLSFSHPHFILPHTLSTIFHRTYARSTHSQNLKEKHSSTYFHTQAHAPDI